METKEIRICDLGKTMAKAVEHMVEVKAEENSLSETFSQWIDETIEKTIKEEKLVIEKRPEFETLIKHFADLTLLYLDSDIGDMEKSNGFWQYRSGKILEVILEDYKNEILLNEPLQIIGNVKISNDDLVICLVKLTSKKETINMHYESGALPDSPFEGRVGLSMLNEKQIDRLIEIYSFIFEQIKEYGNETDYDFENWLKKLEKLKSNF